jgi:pimeloyl-ACP methyl ester carboxylesterase
MTLRTVTLRHNKIDLALHQLREGTGRPLLLLHGLGERTRSEPPEYLAGWAGPVWGLDFTGHGESTVPVGGGYFCEMLMGDVDAALAALDPDSTGDPGVTVLGRGLGGYLALLIAGARPDLVRGAIIADGPGLRGGGPGPMSPMLFRPDQDGTTPDPVALVELAMDIRPPDYARTFAWQASALSGLETAVAITAVIRPPWLAEVAAQPGVIETDLASALTLFAG